MIPPRDMPNIPPSSETTGPVTRSQKRKAEVAKKLAGRQVKLKGEGTPKEAAKKRMPRVPKPPSSIAPSSQTLGPVTRSQKRKSEQAEKVEKVGETTEPAVPKRGKLTEVNVSQLVPEVDKNRAAAKIQKVFREYHFRKQIRTHQLSIPLANQARKELLQRPTHLGSRKWVHAPSQVPVVVKDLNANLRATKIKTAREIISRQNYTHLVVPKVLLVGDVIYEERLPMENGGVECGMLFYQKHQRNCTQAILQITDFLCHVTMGDILGGLRDYYTQGLIKYYVGRALMETAQTPRLDNLLLFQVGEEVKIGLIDLKSMEDTYVKNPGPSECEWALRLVVQIFPYHFDEVVRYVSEKYGKVDDDTIGKLRNKQQKSLQLYKTLCVDYVDFFKRHDITLQNPKKAVAISPERRMQITENLKAWMWNVHENGINRFNELYHKGCIHGDTPEACKENLTIYCNLVVPKLFDSVQDFLNHALDKAKFDPKTVGDVIKMRAKQGKIVRNELINMNETRKKEIQRKHGTYLENNDYFKSLYTDDIFEKILQELAKGGEIFFYGKSDVSNDDILLI